MDKYRRLVSDAVFPDTFSRRRVSLRDATAAITEYRRSTGDITGTVDLMLTFIEARTEQAADLGYGDEPYFSALENKVDAVAKSWSQLPATAQADAATRLARVTDEKIHLVGPRGVQYFGTIERGDVFRTFGVR